MGAITPHRHCLTPSVSGGKRVTTISQDAVTKGGRLMLIGLRSKGRLHSFSIPRGTFVGRLAFKTSSGVATVTIASTKVALFRFSPSSNV